MSLFGPGTLATLAPRLWSDGPRAPDLPPAALTSLCFPDVLPSVRKPADTIVLCLLIYSPSLSAPLSFCAASGAPRPHHLELVDGAVLVLLCGSSVLVRLPL